MSENYKITGKVIHIGQVESFGAKGFKKQIVAIETELESKYPQQIPLEATGKTIDLVKHLQAGDEIEAVFSIGGREHNGRYYPSIKLIGINSEEIQNRVTNGGHNKAKQAEQKRAEQFESEHDYNGEEFPF
jgi:hypothetical protein